MKKNRLEENNYLGINAYSLTFCCCDGKPLIKSSTVADIIFRALTLSGEMTGFSVVAYCLMPDHAHVLVIATSAASNLIKYAQLFKQMSAYGFMNITGRHLWQRSFYDHAVRKEESLAVVADYIVNNPVRKGIVEDPANYPYTWVSDKDYCDG